MRSDDARRPDDDVASRWEAAMRRGDFEAAWRETDRLETPRRELERTGRFAWSPNYLLWKGESWSGKRVLVRCNHGLGDTLQFIRFVPSIRRSADSVVVLAQPPLVRLLGMSADFGEVRDGWMTDVPPHDVEMEIMELAYILRCTPGTLPRPAYLPAKKIAEMGTVILPQKGKGLHVGLLWKASGWDETRSFPISALKPFHSVRAVHFYHLQQGEKNRLPSFGCDLSPFTTEIAELAAAMLQLDLIITVDSMAAHLAGALGVPVWVLLKERADWRWMDRRQDSPWYPKMRLFRQSSPGDWSSVSRAVIAALENFSLAVTTPRLADTTAC